MRVLINTVEVHLQLYSILRDLLPTEARGRTTIHLEVGATLADIIELLDIRRNVVIGVNGDYERDHTRSL